jgi:hypothetical protein
MGKATQVAVRAEAVKNRMLAFKRVLEHQWQPVVIPALVLWLVAMIITCVFVRPIDIFEYDTYAHAALHAPLLHRFPAEYPAPALAVFLLPLLLPFSYPWAFAVLCGVVLVLLAVSYNTSGVTGMDTEAARRLIAYLALGAVIVVAGRYDIFAAAAAFWAVRAARQDRWSAAWTWSCLGFVIKLFPAIFWPAFLIAEWRRTGRLPVRRLAWMVGALLVVAGIPALVNGSGALNALRFYGRRPNEIESIPAGLSLLFDWHHTSWVTSFHSVNVVNGASRPVAVVLEILAVLGCLWIWRAQIQKRLPFEAACLATLTLAILGSKVLSSQYFIWLMPLWALYAIRRAWLAAALINVVLFFYIVSVQDHGYVAPYPFEVSATLALLLRDLLVAWGTWTWLRSVLEDAAPSHVDLRTP